MGSAPIFQLFPTLLEQQGLVQKGKVQALLLFCPALASGAVLKPVTAMLHKAD